MHAFRTFVFAAVVTASSACDIYWSNDDASSAGRLEAIATVSFEPIRELDILFVIDNSGSTDEEQGALVRSFESLLDVLSSGAGGLPSVHLGVVSTDVGAGGYSIASCEGDGDNGALQSQPRGACDAPRGAFIADIANPDGSRTRNYEGDIRDAFACISRLGSNGCGFEQPLESMRRALDGRNAGFLRSDAHLAVIFDVDEDDCSAADSSMYDPSDTTVSDPLGPLSSFRCFEFGVECDVGNDAPRAPGERRDCRPRRDSQFMTHPEEYVDFLRSLKNQPERVFVAGLIGDIAPVSVGTGSMGNPELDPSCEAETGEADPGIRMAWFIDAFAGHSTRHTVCNGDQTSALRSIGASLTGRKVELCLPENTADEPGCEVVEQDVALPPCSPDASNAPCFSVAADELRCGARAPLLLTVRRAAAPTTATAVRVSCLVR